uniref:Uncharacterized protein n=1 Tax=Trichogramma kaykai TaxID=54128 RepID=A0ABD2XDM5_9HYME
MPWVAACISLLAEPLLSYCLTVRDFALQAGILHPQVSQSLISSVMDAQDSPRVMRETYLCDKSKNRSRSFSCITVSQVAEISSPM